MSPTAKTCSKEPKSQWEHALDFLLFLVGGVWADNLISNLVLVFRTQYFAFSLSNYE